MSNLAEKIKMLRKQKGLTLEQVANIVGVGKSTVRKWETGMIKNMGRDKIILLAKAFDVTPAYLLGWEEQERTNDAIADIVVKLRTDTEFLETVELIYNLDDDKLNLVKQMLLALK